MFPVMKETPAEAGRNEVYIMETGLSIAQMQRGMDVEGFYLLKAAFAIDSRMEIYREVLAPLKAGEFSQRVFALDNRRVYKHK